MHNHIALIVSAYVKRNAVPASELPALITQVGAVLYGLDEPVAPEPAATPAVAVRRSVLPDLVVCLDCGWQGKVLRRHIRVAHGLSRAAYRSRWGLKSNHPLVAPSYSKRRSVMAVSLRLGRQLGNTERTSDALATKQPARRGRPRK